MSGAESNLIIEPGHQVTLHFALKLTDGQTVDSNFNAEPATLVVGDGNLPQGFEQAIIGLSSGDQGAYRIPPVKAFGMPNLENVREFPRSNFADDMKLEEGLVVSFADAANTELPGVVKSFSDERVEIDFNHPLAGRELIFEVNILSVEAKADVAETVKMSTEA
ncbi:peptidylprolyl isomerase [Endozoicomonas sp. OPT23]|uniref:FKBP-type peptidyl-prolyl cis-trans isomerase n=1 Tax=Endozoicomonas sp. OPT23 TaxID=2072845 RepID=UPI00129B3B43|nr:peptidylprolyl isomerase [Endozoicomonas sp. OPT23]MRI33727.1 peptidylprolyl isomerase [Endozoicomonas sp. OPT23]